MSHRPHLPNAPITEAVLDVQAVLPDGIRLKQLEAMHRDIQDRFPNRRTRKRIEGTLDIKGGGQIQTTPTEDGYIFATPDGKRLVQARLDGFTFNQLRPYETWEALRDEAKKHWSRYVEIAHPESVTRIALRYINQIAIPLPFSDFKEYVRTAPDIAPGIPPGVQNFFLRMEIPYPSGALAIVTETLLPEKMPATAKTVTIIFDIDVIRAEMISPPFLDMWDKFEELRRMKNDIFFSTITPAAERLFQ